MFVSCTKDISADSFTGNVLVMPAISVGNVGQLACDVLIYTLNFKKVGYFCTEYFLPVAGHNPFATKNEDQNLLTLNSEVYHDSDLKITVIQLRSPLLKGKKQSFCAATISWFKDSNFKELVVLSSCHAFERTDAQLIGLPFRCLKTPSLIDEELDNMEWKALEERSVGFGDRSLFLPGSGFTKQLYQACCEKKVPSAVLLLFCSEGDNIPEAMELLKQLNKWKQFFPKDDNWKPPMSWSHLFGNNPPQEIF